MDRLLLRLVAIYYYPQLLFHMGTTDMARGDRECIKHDYMAQRVLANAW